MHDAFLEELKKLQSTFMNMGINVSEQIYQASTTFLNHNKSEAKKIVNDDTQVNTEEVDLEKEALNLIALQQPVAAYFRQIICILKASSDLERIGDHASSIAQETLRMKKKQKLADVDEIISKMTLKIREMLEATLDAYLHENESAAKLIAQDDLTIDKYFVESRNLIIAEIEKDTKKIPSAASYLLVIRLLERIGDHIVNLDEWVVYNHSGKLVELNPGKIEPDLIKKELKAEKEEKVEATKDADKEDSTK
ncbi:phosphate signaling complex protein PhoU [Lactobacillaceae bacterium Scapto_B20]